MPGICTNPTALSSWTTTRETSKTEGLTEKRTLNLPDLRRRDARIHIEQIIGRAAYLPREERALIMAVYQQGQSYAQLADLCGQSARCLRREVKRILQRMASREFAFVAVNMDSWPSTMRRVAQTCVLEGAPVRSASASLQLSLHTVRKHRTMVRFLAEGIGMSVIHPTRSKAG